jgi:hypothetical protein
MDSFVISVFVFVVVYGGALAGMVVHSRLPAHHREQDTKTVVQLVMGLVATMTALLLSLLIASSHDIYETQQSEVLQLSVNIILLDDILARYGPETAPVRALLKRDATLIVRAISPVEGVGSITLAPPPGGASRVGMLEQVEALTPTSQAQTYDKAAALSLMTDIAKARLLIHEQSMRPIPKPLFVVMLVWLVLLFFWFGLLARPNATILVAMLCGSLSVAAAVFLILDMSHPYSGLTRVSVAPMQNALQQIDQTQ